MAHASPGLHSFWDGTTLPMTRCKQFRSTNLDTVHNYMASLFCDHDLIAEGGSPPLNFQHNHARLNDVTFHATDYGLPFGRVVVDLPEIDKIEAVLRKELGVNEIGLELPLTPIKLEGPAAAFACLVRAICDDIDSGASTYRHARVSEAVIRNSTTLLRADLRLTMSGAPSSISIGT